MARDRCYKALLEAYVAVYKGLGPAFQEIDKFEGWFMNNKWEKSLQEGILESVSKNDKQPNLEKGAVSFSFCLGF